MRLLFLGDVMGRAGRKAVAEHLPRLRDEWRLDFVVVNGENASGGMGLTGDHAKGLLDAGADCLTLGDHAFDQKDMLQFIEGENRILRPLNFAKGAPGRDIRRKVQIVFQNPYGSLNLRQRVGAILEEPLIINRPQMSAAERTAKAREMIGRQLVALCDRVNGWRRSVQ